MKDMMECEDDSSSHYSELLRRTERRCADAPLWFQNVWISSATRISIKPLTMEECISIKHQQEPIKPSTKDKHLLPPTSRRLNGLLHALADPRARALTLHRVVIVVAHLPAVVAHASVRMLGVLGVIL